MMYSVFYSRENEKAMKEKKNDANNATVLSMSGVNRKKSIT